MLLPVGVGYSSDGTTDNTEQNGSDEKKCEEGFYNETEDGEVICFSNKIPGDS